MVKKIKITILNKNIIEQLLKSSTSVGANYSEAQNACSKKDFRNKIYIAKKELQETIYWLDLLKTSSNVDLDDIKTESVELIKIFQFICSKIE